MLTFTPSQFEKLYAVYQIINSQGHIIFIWYSRASEVLTLTVLKSNPAFDPNQQYTLQIISYHYNNIEALNAASAAARKLPDGMPELNKTVKFNRKGPIVCNETGKIFRNQAEAVQLLGLNQGRLCQHLRGVPGYKSVKGLTFSFSGFYTGESLPVAPVIYPTPQPKYFRVWSEKAPGGNMMERKRQVTREEFDKLPENERMIQPVSYMAH